MTDVPVHDADFRAPGFAINPAPIYRSMRDTGDLVYVPSLDQYVALTFELVAELLDDWRRFSNDEEFFRSTFGGVSMEILDPPSHTKVRGVWADDFRRTGLAPHEGLVRKTVHTAVAHVFERLRADESVDAVKALCVPVPVRVMMALFGLPEGDLDTFLGWSDDMALHTHPDRDGSAAARLRASRAAAGTKCLHDYLGDAAADRAATPQDDLIGRLVTSEVASELNPDDIRASLTQLVFAGHETTSKLLTSMLQRFADDREQWELLREEPDLVGRAVDEVMRIDSPVQMLWKYPKEEQVEVAGHRLPGDAKIMCNLAAANRDPARWEQPNEFDISRTPARNLGFGSGIHTCLGLNLARLEAEILLEALLEQDEYWAVRHPVEYGRNWVLRAPIELHVSLA